MHVKGITEVIAHGYTTSAGRGLAIAVAEFNEDLSTFPSGANVVSYTRASNGGSLILKKDGLAAAKEYVVSIYAAGGDANFYAVEFTAGTVTTYIATYKAGDGTGDDVVDNAAVDVAGCPATFAAPSGKVFAGWKNESNEDVAVGSLLTGNITLTAQWVDPVTPTIVFANAVYYVEGMDLDLSKLFTSNSSGAVTYKVENDDESTGAVISGNKFKATSVGSVLVSASQAAAGIYAVGSAQATITVKKALDELVVISTAYTFEPSATIPVSTLAEGNKLFTAGDSECDYSSGMRIKENRSLAFKVATGATVKVTFTEKSDSGTPRQMKLGTAMTGDASKVYGSSGSSPATFTVADGGVVYLTATSDLRFSKLEVLYTGTAIENTEAEVKTVKTFENGQLIIIKNGIKYNATGAIVK
jgi:hypothetical protein